jgi:CRP/FNR family transcriptional regulator, cyclic AMP receptor protein
MLRSLPAILVPACRARAANWVGWMSSLGYVFGFIGAALMVASYLMKSMLPLRLVALSANVFLVIYAFLGGSWPTMALYLAMIPINLKKVVEIRKLVRAIRRAKSDTPMADWLLPHMSRREAKAGTVLWHKGDVATEMVYVHAGQLRLVEHGAVLGAGALVGEIGLFAPDNRRTGSIVCETDCTLYALSADAMAQLYYVNPKLGFHVMRLIVARLMHDAEVARHRGDDRAPTAAAALAPPAA